MKLNEILIAEISGKRPGGVKERPTEGIKTRYDHVIISNNSEGYESSWDIINVPPEYEAYYRERFGFDKAWQAPMNRSYAIRFARERGYRYLVQLDDNIKNLQVAYVMRGEIEKRYQASVKLRDFDDFVSVLIEALRRTNAGMSGMSLTSCVPDAHLCSERFVYSFFALDLTRVPDTFHGNFEDDIQFRLRLSEMGVPTISIPLLGYGKTSSSSGDRSGCRKTYAEVGLGRGDVLRRIHGDIYTCGTGKKISTAGKQKKGEFEHRLKPFKIGVLTRDWWRFEHKVLALLRKHANFRPSAKIEECAE